MPSETQRDGGTDIAESEGEGGFGPAAGTSAEEPVDGESAGADGSDQQGDDGSHAQYLWISPG
jgi:hypothetical protein